MKTRKVTTGIICFLLGVFLFSSCDKQNNEPEQVNTQVQFSFIEKSLKTTNENSLSTVVISIEDLEGNIIKNSESINLFDMNGHYISEPIDLLTGDYTLTQYLILNDANEVVYASPLTDSPKAYLVDQPLPIGFTAVKDEVVTISPEVLSTANCTPEDFGYATFGFQVVSTFDFLVGAFIYNETIQNFEITTADITISNGTNEIYTGQLEANTDAIGQGITNQITLSENYDNYTIEISKSGYVTYSSTFTKDELKLHLRSQDNGPLIVILEEETEFPGLVAYYPFNNSADDASGNDYHGTDFGASGYLAGQFDYARTFVNDPTVGVNATDYVTLPNVINSEEFTINFWVNTQFDGNHQTILYLSEGEDWVGSNFFLCANITDLKLNVMLNGLDLRTEDYTHQALKDGRYNDTYLNSGSLELNRYQNVTCTFKNSEVALYIDGAEIARYTNVNRVVGTPNADIKVGVCPKPGMLYYPLVGQLDDLRFYNRELSANEISSLAQSN